MTKLLINYIEKNKSDENKREGLGVLSGISGIFLNVFLCILKFVVGGLSGSVSITADAVNNLADATTNIVTVAGSKLSSKPVDKEHPFGHGRIEYISALIVAFFIFVMSFELGKSSVMKIIKPQDITYSVWYLAILAAAVLIKLWMAYFNEKLYRITGNLNLKAVRQDSLNDSVATFSTIVALVVSSVYHIKWLDGAIGVAVAVFVFASGVGIVKNILGPLLGQPPSKKLTNRIEKLILKEALILGVHDLIVHDYGPGRIIASAHAEVPSNIDVMAIHEAIDNAEHRIMNELGIVMCIHMDPIVTDDEETLKYKKVTEKIINEYNKELSFHDFRLSEREGQKCLSFDITVPLEIQENSDEIEKKIKEIYKKKYPKIKVEINVEHLYV